MDDIVTAYQCGPKSQFQLFDRTLKYLKWILPYLAQEINEPVNTNKIIVRKGGWNWKKIILGWKVNTEQGNLSFPNYNRANLLYILDILYAQNLIGQKNIWVFIGGIHSMQLAVPIAV